MLGDPGPQRGGPQGPPKDIWEVQLGHEDTSSEFLISFDFSDAFPTLTHEFITAMPHLGLAW